jgi:hypothetical protein
MFIELLKRTVASTGGTLIEVKTHTTKLSQFCHGCGKMLNYVDTLQDVYIMGVHVDTFLRGPLNNRPKKCPHNNKKPLWQRWHVCECGVGPIQRDLYSAFLAAYLDAANDVPSCARYSVPWEGAETRLRAAQERLFQRANEGQVLPRSMGIPRARARQPQSLSEPKQEPIFLLRGGRLEAWNERSEPSVL